MRTSKRSGGFLICLLFNILLNPEGLILSAVLVVLHFAFGWSMWWAAAAFGIWLAWMIVRMLIIGWANKCGNSTEIKRENKNPYSVGQNKDNPNKT